MRLIEYDLVTWGYRPVKASQYPHIVIDGKTYYSMRALKNRKESFIKKFKKNLITYNEAFHVIGKPDQLINNKILTVQYPKVRYPLVHDKHAVFVVVDSWFLEYARYMKKIKWDDIPENIVDKAVNWTVEKMLVSY